MKRIIFMLLLIVNVSYAQTITIGFHGEANKHFFDEIKAGASRLYGTEKVVSKNVSLPKSTYRNGKYRADVLLTMFPAWTMVVTSADISAPRREIKDWGIFGLAGYDSKTGIASSKRVGNRVLSVVLHEMGHMYGLRHCPNTSCLMKNVHGKMITDKQWLCPECKKKLK